MPTKIKDLVKDEEWQKIRKTLLGQWSKRPEWCCLQLNKFLGPITKTSNDKIRIVLNYVTGTGFRIGKISHPCIQSIKTKLSSEIAKRKAKGIW